MTVPTRFGPARITDFSARIDAQQGNVNSAIHRLRSGLKKWPRANTIKKEIAALEQRGDGNTKAPH